MEPICQFCEAESPRWQLVERATDERGSEICQSCVDVLYGRVRCADGSFVHNFQGQPTCPGCGWAGIEGSSDA